MALPNSAFIRSAWASGVDRPRAMSLVTCTPPTGTASVKTRLPPTKHADRRRAAAHIDDRDAEVHLVLDEAGETGGVGADDEGIDIEHRPRHRGAVVAHRARGGGDDVHVDAEPLADHAARVSNAAAVVDRKPDRDGVNDLPVTGVAHQVAALQHMAHIAIADLATADADLGLDHARGAKSARTG